jgi:microcystin-dependent protein
MELTGIVKRTDPGQSAALPWATVDGNFQAIKNFCDQIGASFNEDGSLQWDVLKDVLINYLASSFINSTYSFLAPVGKLAWYPKELGSEATSPTEGGVWVLCDGTKKLQADYPKLYAYLGDWCNAMSTVGGDVNTATEFRVLPPGVFLFGSGITPGIADAGIAAGTLNGAKAHTLINANMPDHVHTWKFSQAHADNDNIEAGILAANPTTATGDTTVTTSTVGNVTPTPISIMPPNVAGYHYILAGYKVNGQWV